jgi:hypothetical protein
MITVKKGPVSKYKNKWYTSIIFYKLFHLLKIRPTLRAINACKREGLGVFTVFLKAANSDYFKTKIKET